MYLYLEDACGCARAVTAHFSSLCVCMICALWMCVPKRGSERQLPRCPGSCVAVAGSGIGHPWYGRFGVAGSVGSCRGCTSRAMLSGSARTCACVPLCFGVMGKLRVRQWLSTPARSVIGMCTFGEASLHTNLTHLFVDSVVVGIVLLAMWHWQT